MVEYIERSKKLTITTYTTEKDDGGIPVRNGKRVDYNARITIDMDAVLHELATRATTSKSKRAQLMHGAIKVDIKEA